MTEIQCDSQPELIGESQSIRAAIRQHGWLLLGVSLATVAIELGTYAAARMCDVSAASAAVATLGVCAVWVALAAGVLASGPRTHLAGVVYGAIVADASLVSLVGLWLLAEGSVTLAAAGKVYCTLAAMSLASAAVVRCGRSVQSRAILAVLSSVVLMLMLASPFWVGGLLEATGPSLHGSMVAKAVYANPFYSITAAVSEQTGFVWHLSRVMYGVTRIGSYVPAPEVPWYAAAVVYSCAAVLAGGACLLGGLMRRPTGP